MRAMTASVVTAENGGSAFPQHYDGRYATLRRRSSLRVAGLRFQTQGLFDVLASVSLIALAFALPPRSLARTATVGVSECPCYN